MIREVSGTSEFMTASELMSFLHSEFPQVFWGGREFFVCDTTEGNLALKMIPGKYDIRPGGTVSGPTIFTLADLSAYVGILSRIGPVGLAVTTNINMSFLRKPPPLPLVGHCQILKLGKRLATAAIAIRDEKSDLLFAHATATYSIPPWD